MNGSWNLVYTTNGGSSAGKLGPFVGDVEQRIFLSNEAPSNDDNDDEEDDEDDDDDDFDIEEARKNIESDSETSDSDEEDEEEDNADSGILDDSAHDTEAEDSAVSADENDMVEDHVENNDDESKKDGVTSTLLSTATTNEGKMTDSDDVKETPVITTSALIKKPGLRRQATDTTPTILNKSPKRFKRARSLPETESEKEQLPEKFRNNKMLENFDLKLIKAVFFAQGGANIGDFISKMPSAKRRKRST